MTTKITKKQLQEQYKLSHNTVTETLKACNLDTARREYSQEEIDSLFLPARKMLDEGQTYEAVKATFSKTRPSRSRSWGADPATEIQGAESGEFAEQIAAEIEAGTRDIIQQVARSILHRLPVMTIEVLNEMARNNDVQAVYQKYRSEVFLEVSSAQALPPDESTPDKKNNSTSNPKSEK